MERLTLASGLLLLDLPSEVLSIVLGSLSAGELCQACSVTKAFSSLVPGLDEVWKERCRQRWTTKSPRFMLPLQSDEVKQDWAERYKQAELDSRRLSLHPHELADLKWHFQFNGNEDECQKVQFIPGNDVNLLLVDPYPPLPCWLRAGVQGQTLQIANFPIHWYETQTKEPKKD